MFDVEDSAGEWKKMKLSRREEVVLNRLSAGHTFNAGMFNGGRGAGTTNLSFLQ